MSEPQTLAIAPRDGWFVKDGRGWHTSASGRAHGHDWPPPTTVLGALRGGCGRVEETASGQPLTDDQWLALAGTVGLELALPLRRPWGATEWTAAHRLWPAPLDALRVETEGGPRWERLEPVPPRVATLGSGPLPAADRLWRPHRPDQVEKPVPAPGWWADQDFLAWLRGEHPDSAPAQPEQRLSTQVRLDRATGTTDDGALFSHPVIEPFDRHHEWAIGCRALLPPGSRLDQGLLTLGSRSRLAACEALPTDLYDPPAALLAELTGATALRLVLVTPGSFRAGWLPDGVEADDDSFRGTLPGGAPLVLRAALVGRPVHLSGWDIRRNRPKPIARLAPAGAVYFFERSDGGTFTANELRALWLAGLGGRTDEGFGRVVPGLWTPKGGDR